MSKPRRIVAPFPWEEPMKDLRAPRRLIRMWRRRAAAAIDPLAHAPGDAKGAAPASRSAFTPSGQPIEDQVRKAWLPSGTGLATF